MPGLDGDLVGKTKGLRPFGLVSVDEICCFDRGRLDELERRVKRETRSKWLRWMSVQTDALSRERPCGGATACGLSGCVALNAA